jgi:tRNA isopentenyl-2-thiomethyl-A-37 hydroxylase MiaE
MRFLVVIAPIYDDIISDEATHQKEGELLIDTVAVGDAIQKATQPIFDALQPFIDSGIVKIGASLVTSKDLSASRDSLLLSVSLDLETR